MSALTGPYFVAVLVLALAGAPKLVRPDETVRALASIGWPSARWLVRLGGGAETVVALLALAGLPGAAWLVAGCYAGFTVFVAAALARGGVVSSCGCFGRPDTPPTPTHLAFVAACCACAALVALAPADPSLPAVLGTQPWAGLPFLAALVTGAGLGLLVLEELPRLRGRVRA